MYFYPDKFRYGKRQPAKVVSLDEVPENRRRALRTKKPGTRILEFIGKEKFCFAETSKLVHLGETEQDHIWGEDNVDYLRALRLL